MENNFYEMLQNETHKENEKIKIKIGIRQIFIEKVRGTYERNENVVDHIDRR